MNCQRHFKTSSASEGNFWLGVSFSLCPVITLLGVGRGSSIVQAHGLRGRDPQVNLETLLRALDPSEFLFLLPKEKQVGLIDIWVTLQ
jgi:hypothetical protein